MLVNIIFFDFYCYSLVHSHYQNPGIIATYSICRFERQFFHILVKLKVCEPSYYSSRGMTMWLSLNWFNDVVVPKVLGWNTFPLFLLNQQLAVRKNCSALEILVVFQTDRCYIYSLLGVHSKFEELLTAILTTAKKVKPLVGMASQQRRGSMAALNWKKNYMTWLLMSEKMSRIHKTGKVQT